MHFNICQDTRAICVLSITVVAISMYNVRKIASLYLSNTPTITLDYIKAFFVVSGFANQNNQLWRTSKQSQYIIIHQVAASDGYNSPIWNGKGVDQLSRRINSPASPLRSMNGGRPVAQPCLANDSTHTRLDSHTSYDLFVSLPGLPQFSFQERWYRYLCGRC